MHKLKDKLRQLRALYPKHTRYGQLYRKVAETKGAFNRITLYTIFVNDDGQFLMRPHVFHKKDVRTAKEWHAWFSNHLTEVMKEGVLPGLARRTGLEQQWAVFRYIGWVANAEFIPRDTPVDARRNTPKKKGRKNG